MNLKRIIPLTLSVVALGGLLAAYYPKKYNEQEKEALLVKAMLSTIDRSHYQPKQINDNFSQKVYDLYLERVDYWKRFLTQQDLEKLSKYKLSLDDEALAGNYEFFNLSMDLLNSGMAKGEKFYKEILATPFDFSKNESFELDGKKRTFAKDDKELEDYWRKMLKHEVLSKVVDKLDAQEKDPKIEQLTEVALEKKAREESLKNYDEYYKQVKKRKRAERLSDYLNSFANILDPHTEYFEPKDKEKFNQDMAGRLEGIGARLQTDGDYTKVNEVVVGGPAWKEGELKEKDIIVKVAQGEAEPVDVTAMPIDDVVKMIKGKKGTEVRLTVKKVDGTTKVIKIVRDIVVLDEGFAKSLVVNNEFNDKVGYIKLPRFYADFEKADGRSCAEDVKVEVEKLKRQNVAGIVIDLRNNGGGSLRDVVEMSGLFIDKGPMVQVKGRGNRPEVLTDDDASVQYAGPLVVMVNHMSASASEIMAAALQDYGRAIIVGAKSTYGKGTVQRFFDLDRSVMGNADVKPLGEVKVTIQKFYRISGASTQLKGVTPDVTLPDAYNYLKYGEQENEYPMEWNEIAPVAYDKSKAVTADRLAKIKTASEARVKANTTFKMLEENSKRLKRQKDDSVVSLGMKEYRMKDAKADAEAKKYDEMFKPIAGLNAINPTEDMEYIKVDTSRIARNDSWIKNVKKDVQLYETLMIMHDMIKQNMVASQN